jgi:hypothetical protein
MVVRGVIDRAACRSHAFALWDCTPLADSVEQVITGKLIMYTPMDYQSRIANRIVGKL